jgi:hypothetical protein
MVRSDVKQALWPRYKETKMQISRTTFAKRQSLSAEISSQYLPAISRTGFRIAQVTVLRLLLVLGMVGVVSFWTASEASAQQVFGSIDGTVTDSTGAAVVGGTVRVTETTKGVTFTQTTNSSGFYSQGQLIPGTYAVSVEALGFKKAV